METRRKVLAFGPIIGIIVFCSICLFATFTDMPVAFSVDIRNVCFVVIATLACLLISFPTVSLVETLRAVKSTLFKNVDGPSDICEKIVSLAEKSRREGILSLENELELIDHDILYF